MVREIVKIGDENKKRPVQMDEPESADDRLISPSCATTSPARQDMEMMVLHMVGCCVSHSTNLIRGSSTVNVESGAICE
jgi:hypothetical protein